MLRRGRARRLLPAIATAVSLVCLGAQLWFFLRLSVGQLPKEGFSALPLLPVHAVPLISRLRRCRHRSGNVRAPVWSNTRLKAYSGRQRAVTLPKPQCAWASLQCGHGSSRPAARWQHGMVPQPQLLSGQHGVHGTACLPKSFNHKDSPTVPAVSQQPKCDGSHDTHSPVKYRACNNHNKPCEEKPICTPNPRPHHVKSLCQCGCATNASIRC
jgi:hypothetical protein